MLNKNIKTIYFIGIKGVGMTMLAQFLKSSGFKIFGSDVNETFMTDKVLKDCGIKVFQGFSKDNLKKVKDIDLVIYSSAYNKNTNEELAVVLENKKVLTLSYAQALGEVFNRYKGIAVIGSHGKTTVSAWLSFVLKELDQEPNALIGARVPQFSGSGLKGASEYLVAEVDEYQNKLKYFKPFGVVLNNIDWDHHDYFKTFDEYLKVFIDFIKKIPKDGFLVYNFDDKNCCKVAKYFKGRKLGFSLNEANYNNLKNNQINKVGLSKKDECILKIFDNKFKKGEAIFSFLVDDNKYINYRSGLLGKHNLSNSLAVLSTLYLMNLNLIKAKKFLNKFKGTARRQEELGRYKGCILIDDYAHHPTEIQKTIEALRAKYNDKKLFVVFHPHTYTRTKMLLKDFSESFSLVDKVFVLDIYGSAREKSGGISSYDLIKKIEKYNKKNNIDQEIIASGDIKETTDILIKEIEDSLKKCKNKEDKPIIILMGAGDVFRVGENLLNK